jgi:hypothetical protein
VLEKVSIGCIGIARNTEQLLGLLPFECTHLILEHLALEVPLPLTFKAFELDTLGR